MICGTFNNWLPEMMEKYSVEEVEKDSSKEEGFVYRRKLLAGFKYRFNFILDNSEEAVIDETQE
jgi:hypothetical protein